MLTTILVLLIVLWLLGMVSSYTLGGFIHILLVLADRGRADPRDPGPKADLTGRVERVRVERSAASVRSTGWTAAVLRLY